MIITSNKQIHNHLQTQFKELYCKAILLWIKYYSKLGYSVLNDVILNDHKEDKSDIIDEFEFIQRIYNLIDDNKQLKQIVLNQQCAGNTLFSLIYHHANDKKLESLKYILFNKRINDDDKIKYIIQQKVRLPILKKLMEQQNHEMLNKIDAILKLFNLRASEFVTQHKVFNYMTINPVYLDDFKYSNETEYKYTVETRAPKGGSLCVFGTDDGFSNKYVLGLGQKYVAEYYQKHCGPTNIDIFNNENLMQISTSKVHTLCIDINGNVYVWGGGKEGQLGLGDKIEYAIKPQLLPSFCKYKAKHIAVSETTSLILTEDGNIWSFGANHYGQLGHGNDNSLKSPKLVEALRDYNIVQISCSDQHSCAISQDGILFTFGGNKLGQCGFIKDEKILIPTQVNMDGLISVYSDCGECYTLLLTIDGIVLSFGRNEGLGHGEMSESHGYRKPKIIAGLLTKRVVDIACGESHSLCVTEDGQLYSFGSDIYGQCGHATNYNPIYPKKVDYFDKKNINIIACFAGTYHSGVITSNGELFMFGFADHGQLVHGKDDFQQNLPIKVEYFKNKYVTKMALGYGHSLIVTKKDDDDDVDHKDDDDVDHDTMSIYFKHNENDKYIKNKIENNLKNKSYKIFMKNEKLFNYKDWILMCGNRKYSPFPQYTTSFINNLQICGNDTIKLLNTHKIDEMYHNEILESKYVLLNEGKTSIKTELISKHDIIVFDSIKNIKFEIPKPKDNIDKLISLYVQTPKSNHFVLIKQFKK